MLYKISERDENAYSEQVQNSKSKNICAFYFDIFTILKLFSCFGAFDEKCRFNIQHWFHGSVDQNLEILEKNLGYPRLWPGLEKMFKPRTGPKNFKTLGSSKFFLRILDQKEFFC